MTGPPRMAVGAPPRAGNEQAAEPELWIHASRGLRFFGIARKEILHRFDQIVAYSGLERFIDTPVKRYSTGMYVRLAFSVAAQLAA